MTLNINPNPVSLRDALIADFHKAATDPQTTLKEKAENIHAIMKKILMQAPGMREFFDENSLTARGIDYILQRKYPGGSPIKVCEYIEDFDAKVEECKNQETFALSFIARGKLKKNNSFFPQFNHFTHTYMERRDGKVRIFITESTKAFQQSFYVMNAKWNVFTDAEVYLLNVPRQFDQYTCPIFALKDAILFMRHPEICDKLAQYKKIEFSVYYPDLPPPMLMRCAQSKEVLTKYLQEAKNVYPAEEITSLEEKLQKHQMILERVPEQETPTSANGRAFHFLCKYVEIILREKIPELPV